MARRVVRRRSGRRPVGWRHDRREHRHRRTAWGYGLATITDDGVTLDTWYPAPALGPAPSAGTQLRPGRAGLGSRAPTRRAASAQVVLRTEIDLDAPPADVPDAYLRLHLLSHRLVRPHGLNLDGLFGVLANVVWTSSGPCAVDDFERTRLRLLRGAPRRCRVTSSASTSSRG